MKNDKQKSASRAKRTTNADPYQIVHLRNLMKVSSNLARSFACLSALLVIYTERKPTRADKFVNIIGWS